MCSRRRGGQHTPSSTRPYSHPVLPPIQRALEPTPVLCRRSPLGGWPIPALAHALVRAARCARSRSLAWPWPRSSAPNPPRHTHTRTDLPAHLDHPALAAPRMLARVVPPRSGCAAHACARSACKGAPCACVCVERLAAAGRAKHNGAPHRARRGKRSWGGRGLGGGGLLITRTNRIRSSFSGTPKASGRFSYGGRATVLSAGAGPQAAGTFNSVAGG